MLNASNLQTCETPVYTCVLWYTCIMIYDNQSVIVYCLTWGPAFLHHQAISGTVRRRIHQILVMCLTEYPAHQTYVHHSANTGMIMIIEP